MRLISCVGSTHNHCLRKGLKFRVYSRRKRPVSYHTHCAVIQLATKATVNTSCEQAEQTVYC